MDKRTLGRNGLEVSALGLGCMGLGRKVAEGELRDQMIGVIRRAVELGVTFFDTAQVYGPLTNEQLVGEALAPYRGEVVIATKFGLVDVDGQAAGSRPETSRLPPKVLCGAWASTRSTSTTSTASIPTSRSKTSPARSRTWSKPARSSTGDCPKPPQGRSGAPTPCSPLTAVQSEYSLWWKRPEDDVLPTLEELGIGFVPFSPLGKGFLTGTIDAATTFAEHDIRASIPRFEADARTANVAMVDLLRTVAERLARNPRPDRPRLAARPAPVDRPDPGHRPRSHDSRRTSAARSSSLAPTTYARSTRPPPTLPSSAPATPKHKNDGPTSDPTPVARAEQGSIRSASPQIQVGRRPTSYLLAA